MISQRFGLLLAVTVSAAPSTSTNALRGISPKCFNAAADFFGLVDDNAPRVPGNFMNFIAQQTQWATITDHCEVPLVTGSFAGAFSSYVSALNSWQNEHKSETSNVYSVCKEEITGVPEILALGTTGVVGLCDELKWQSAEPTAVPAPNVKINYDYIT